MGLTGKVTQAPVQAEITVGYGHLMVIVRAEACAECGEAYYAEETCDTWSASRRSLHEKRLLHPRWAKCTTPHKSAQLSPIDLAEAGRGIRSPSTMQN